MKIKSAMAAAAIAASIAVQSTPSLAAPVTTWNHSSTGGTQVGNCTGTGGFLVHWLGWRPCITI